MSRKQLGYDVFVTFANGRKYINGYKPGKESLERIKEQAVHVSLLWKGLPDECGPYKTGGGIRLIHVYRVSKVEGGAGGHKVHRDMVGYAFNGKWYPKNVWWNMQYMWRRYPQLAVYGCIPEHLEHWARFTTWDEFLNASVAIYLGVAREYLEINYAA